MLTKRYKHTKKELRWGRIATSAIFFVMGAGNGSWLARIPDIEAKLRLNPAILGVVLLAGAVGGLFSMQLVPKLIATFGHRTVLGVVGPLYPLTLCIVALAPNVFTLTAALLLFGSWGSVLGVVVNTHAIDVELAYERSIMSSFHALYSIGGLIGAGVGGLLASSGISTEGSIIGAAAALLIVMLIITPRLLRIAHMDAKEVEASLDKPSDHHHKRAWWRGVLLIGCLTFVCYLAEGSISDWSAVFMRNLRHANPAIAISAFVAFSACMAVGRLSGDYIAMKIGKIKVVQFGAFLASAGLLIGILVPNTIISVAGFAVVGCGLSALVPVLFSIAGSLTGGERHAAIARVSTIAFFGLLVGPAAIGFIANHVGLVYALLIPATLLAIVGLFASNIRRVTRRNVAL